MKAEFKFWPDTNNIDLILKPEGSTEESLLAALAGRKPSYVLKPTPGVLEVVFEPPVKETA